MRDELLEELLAKPVGPAIAKRETRPDDFTHEITLSGNTADVEIRQLEEAVSEGTALKFLEEEGQNPDEWEVTHFRKIKYGAGLESVRFSFRRVQQPPEHAIRDEVVSSWRERLQVGERFTTILPIPQGATYAIKIADPQFGKKGTEEAVENLRRGLLAHIEHARSLGDKVEAVHLAWMGDETENVVNSYGNQPHTIELNRTQQLELDYDMRVWAVKEALTLGKPLSGSSVISNHGEWTRNGGKDPVTTRGDNASTYVARQVRALFDELAPFTGQQVEWHIGGGEPGVVVTLSGEPCYFSHGYIEKGRGTSTETRTRAAIERQILGRTDTLASVRLWYMAHYHHFYTNEFEGRTLFGCPALEAERSSEYMLDQFGVWSPPGMLGMLVGSHYSRGWSHLNVF